MLENILPYSFLEESLWKADPVKAVLSHGKSIIVSEKHVTLKHIFDNLKNIWPMNYKQSKIVFYDHTESEINVISKLLSTIIEKYEERSEVSDPIDQCENNC
jgi:RNA processing factor Prp31